MKFSRKKNSELAELENEFFLFGHFDFFLFQKKKCFVFSYEKQPWLYRLARMGRNFDDYPGFQPKTTFMYYFAHDCKYSTVNTIRLLGPR